MTDLRYTVRKNRGDNDNFSIANKTKWNIMAKFIEVTDYNDQSLYINVDNILWLRSYEEENGTIIYLSVCGKNDYPVSLIVKESYTQLKEAIRH